MVSIAPTADLAVTAPAEHPASLPGARRAVAERPAPPETARDAFALLSRPAPASAPAEGAIASALRSIAERALYAPYDFRVAKLKADPAHEVYPLTAEQLAEWKKAAEPLQKTWADNVKKTGGNPDEIMKELKDSLAKYKAAY